MQKHHQIRTDKPSKYKQIPFWHIGQDETSCLKLIVLLSSPSVSANDDHHRQHRSTKIKITARKPLTH